MTLVPPALIKHGPLTPQDFGATGDGVTDDSTAWTQFQAAAGLKFIPPGTYKVGADLFRFDQGCFGNGVFIDTHAAGGGYWTAPRGDRERDSMIVHGRSINGNTTILSPLIKSQTMVSYSDTNPETVVTDTQMIGGYFEGVATGEFVSSSEGQEGNYTVFSVTSHNKFAGFHGMTAFGARAFDAKESEVPGIETLGASKSAAGFFAFTRRSRYENGGRMFGVEIFCINIAEETTAIPYPNSDEYAFDGWTCGLHIAGLGGGAPITTAVLIDGRSTTPHTFWNGLVIGGSAFTIDNTPGYPGTVGINMASWRSGSYGHIGIKFRYAGRHIWGRAGLKFEADQTRHMNEDGSCGISVEASGSSGANSAYIAMRDGANSDVDPSTRTLTLIEAFPNNTQITSKLGEIRLQAADGAGIYVATEARFAPAIAQDNTKALGGPDRRWSEVFAGTGTINTSDARLKQQVRELTAAEKRVALACCQLVRAYKWDDAVARKGAENARWHFGVIAQDVVAAFAAEGLDANKYGVLCYDQWDAKPEQVLVTRTLRTPAVHEQVLVSPERQQQIEVEPGVWETRTIAAEYRDGGIITPAVYDEYTTTIPAQAAGNRYGVRYDQLNIFILTALAPVPA